MNVLPESTVLYAAEAKLDSAYRLVVDAARRPTCIRRRLIKIADDIQKLQRLALEEGNRR